MSKTMDRLLEQQESLRHTISRIVPNLKKLGKGKLTPSGIRNRIDTLKERFAQFQDGHFELLVVADESTWKTHQYFVQDQFQDCEGVYDDTLDYLRELLNAVEPSTPKATNVSSADFQPHPAAALPALSLPTFDGSLDHWEAFRDGFRSAVIDNAGISNVQRIQYLRSCLTGEAGAVVERLDLTDANFAIAWSLLASRYENRYKLVMKHLNNISPLDKITVATPKSLRALLDRAVSSLQALRNLHYPTDEWDMWLMHHVTAKLDTATDTPWRMQLGNPVDLPTFKQLEEFLTKRIHALPATSDIPTAAPCRKTGATSSSRASKAIHVNAAANALSCGQCKGSHPLYQCSVFLGKSVSQRRSFVDGARRCMNCLSSKRSTPQCTSARSCRECSQRHHTLLHSPSDAPTASLPSTRPSLASHLAAGVSAPMTTVLLSTALVKLHAPSGRSVAARALLDQGSTTTLVTENIAQMLRLRKSRTKYEISCIGEARTLSRSVVTVSIGPRARSHPVYSTPAVVLTALTQYVLPRFAPHSWGHLAVLVLADDDPASSDPVDIILSADVCAHFISGGVRKGGAQDPIAQNTHLGWVLSGVLPRKIPRTPSDSVSLAVHLVTHEYDFASELCRFWEVEDVPTCSPLTRDKEKCEEHFRTTHSRNDDGRYFVRVPFKTDPPLPIGASRQIAQARLLSLERRLSKSPSHYNAYRQFLHEYESLGHMTLASEKLDAVSPAGAAGRPARDGLEVAYIPHLAVYRASSETSPIRVVFNASSPTENGTSLNDCMHKGPKLQNDLSGIILQWRQYRFAYAADITKMYRQIQVHHGDRDYQRILWRASPTEQIREYQLTTVTYGTAAATYLALRVLKQLGEDEGANYSLAAPILQTRVYVDGCLFGADSLSQAREIRRQLVALLARGGFELRKWASNAAALLHDIDQTNHGLARPLDFTENSQLQILGIAWDPTTDTFRFAVNPPAITPLTKRRVLSATAKIFDPLGWVTPVTITAKIFLQDLWLGQHDWDSPFAHELSSRWMEYQSQLTALQTTSIPL